MAQPGNVFPSPKQIGLLILTLLLFCGGVDAALMPVISLPQQKPTAGAVIPLEVYFHNEGNDALTTILPSQLQLLVSTENGSELQLSAFSDSAEEQVQLPPGSFRKQHYSVKIPADLRGVISYRLAGYSQVGGMMMIAPPQLVPSVDTPTIASGQEEPEDLSLRNLESLYQSYSANFSSYRPTYFLVGTNPQKSKFQISFRYRLFNPSGSLSQKYPWLEGFHIAYTQTSFWDLKSASAPFEDTSYKPEFFYLTSNLKFRPSWMDGLFIQTGIQHESNGRGGDVSRSTNYAYIRPMVIFYHRPSQLGMMISPKFLSYIGNDDETNPDLPDYRGHIELETRIGRAHSLMLATNFHFADKGTSFQADLSYPISRLLKNNLDIYFHIQYSNALAESLINYRDRTEAIRVGISLVR